MNKVWRGIVIIILVYASNQGLCQSVFIDATDQIAISSFNAAPNYGCGVTLVDVDQNGFPDIFLTTNEETPNVLYLNQGNGLWSDGIEIGEYRRSRAALWFDADNDNILDVLIVSDCLDPENCFDNEVVELYRGTAEGAFEDITQSSKIISGEKIVSESRDSYVGGISAGDINLDGYLDIVITRWGGGAFLFINNGDGTFRQQSEILNEPQPQYFFQPVIFDFTNDGWPEIIFIKDNYQENVMLQNELGNSFKDIAPAIGFNHTEHDMGVTIADFDNDKDYDFYISNIQFFNSQSGNALLENQGNASSPIFTDIADDLDISEVGWGWGVSFTDVNNDGWQDLIATNGWRGHMEYEKDQSRLWINDFGTMVDRSVAYQFNDTLIASSLLSGDIDRDGDMDIIQGLHENSEIGYKCRYLKNSLSDSSNAGNYIIVQPRMIGQNHWAVGSSIIVETPEGQQMKPILAGSSFYGQEPYEAFFGIGENDVIDKIKVIWPGGQSTEITNVPVNNIIEITDQGILHTPSMTYLDLIDEITVELKWGLMKTHETNFLVQRSTDTDFENSEEFIFDANTYQFLDSDLTVGQTYYYRLRAYNSTDSSSWSPVDSVQLLSDIIAPTLSSAEYESLESVVLNWSDNSSNEDGFLIQRSTSTSFESYFERSVDMNSTSFIDTNLEPNAEYAYRIVAYNDLGVVSDPSNVITIFTEVDLTPPLGLSEHEISVSPNPINDGLIRIKGAYEHTIELYDMMGKRLDYQLYNQQDTQLIKVDCVGIINLIITDRFGKSNSFKILSK